MSNGAVETDRLARLARRRSMRWMNSDRSEIHSDSPSATTRTARRSAIRRRAAGRGSSDERAAARPRASRRSRRPTGAAARRGRRQASPSSGLWVTFAAARVEHREPRLVLERDPEPVVGGSSLSGDARRAATRCAIRDPAAVAAASTELVAAQRPIAHRHGGRGAPRPRGPAEAAAAGGRRRRRLHGATAAVVPARRRPPRAPPRARDRRRSGSASPGPSPARGRRHRRTGRLERRAAARTGAPRASRRRCRARTAGAR